MGVTPPPDRIGSYAAFWRYYLGEHRRSATRSCHYAGSVAAIAAVVTAAAAGIWWLLPVALIAGYGPAWLGHAVVERNYPATFRYPVWSLISDYRMLALWITGRLEPELRAE